MGRPQDRSGGPTFEREAIRGESSRLQTQAPQHPTTNTQQPTPNNLSQPHHNGL
ncbi:MAG: hypothetical protein ACHBN1_15260 [Heteroscytonema crispum UTEX LB 1556]